MEWLEEQGGLDSVAKTNQKKADLLYQFIDNNAELCRGTARKERSLPDEYLLSTPQRNPRKEARCRRRPSRLPWHQRASAGGRGFGYPATNAVPLEGVERFIAYLETFLQTHCRS